MRLASYIDSQQSKKAARLIIRWRRVLGCVLYCAGLLYLCSLPKRDLSHKSFFDENALLPGVVRREFADPNLIAKFTSEIQGLGNNEDSIIKWLEMKFIELGLEAYTQNFTATKPVSFPSESADLSGRNVYGIIRAGRSLSTESIVLSAPLSTFTDNQSDNCHGIAVMLALTKYFKTKNYWAKDLIFLVTTRGEIGMQSWIDGYMGTVSSGITIQPLAGRSGSIQAVINLELPSDTIQYANIIAEGVNGILPNLDLVNVVVHLCRLEGIETAFYVKWESLRIPVSPEVQYYSSLKTMFAIAAHQAHGLPSSNHGLFLRHRIDSVTVRGVASVDGGGARGSVNSLFNIARAFEGVFRSVNSLLEKLHHSEFFYFTTSTFSFVSIGLYMPPFGLMVAPVVMETLAQWLIARDPGLLLKTVPSQTDTLLSGPSFPFQAVMKLLLVSFVSGALLYATPTLVSFLQYPLRANGLVVGLLIVCGVTALLPILFRATTTSTDWRMAKVFSLIFLILALVATAMMNFSLSVILALVFILPAVLAEPSHVGSKLAWITRICCVGLLWPPLTLLYLCILHQYFSNSHHENESLTGLIFEVIQLAVRVVSASLNAWHFVGSWIYPYVCVVIWPLWLMSWTVCWLSAREKGETHPHSD